MSRLDRTDKLLAQCSGFVQLTIGQKLVSAYANLANQGLGQVCQNVLTPKPKVRISVSAVAYFRCFSSKPKARSALTKTVYLP